MMGLPPPEATRDTTERTAREKTGLECGIEEYMLRKSTGLATVNERMRLTKLPRYLRRSAYVEALIEDHLDGQGPAQTSIRTYGRNNLRKPCQLCMTATLGPRRKHAESRM